MSKSTNYNFQLDTQGDYYDINTHNGNYQIIDTTLKGLENNKASKTHVDTELAKKINTIGNQTLYGSVQFSHGTEINSSSEVSFGYADKIGAKILSKRTNASYIGNEGNLEFYTQVGSVTNTQPLKRMEIEDNGNVNMWEQLKIKKNSTLALNVMSEIETQIFAVDTVNQVLTGVAADKKADKTFVLTKIAELVDSSPATLDTLNELAAALGDDPNFATTISNLIGTKANATDMATALATKVNNSDVATTQTADKIAKRDSAGKVAGVINTNGDYAINISGTNLNNFIKTGYYIGANLINAPNLSPEWFYIETIAHGTSFMLQTATPFAENKKYIRSLKDGTWSSWKPQLQDDGTSLVDNGYTKMSNGLILQWGMTGDNAHGGSCTFPITFPTGCFNVVLTGSTDGNWIVTAKNKSSFTYGDAGVAGAHAVNYIAIGY